MATFETVEPDHDNEIWVNIQGYETAYQLSNFGAIRRIDKKEMNRKVTPYKNEKGYLKIGLSIKGERKTFKVHRLVALHFVENKNKHNEVNHKDSNKINNFYKNLEWCSRKENMQHALSNNLILKRFGKDNSTSRPVVQRDLFGNFVRQWDCIKDAERALNIKSSHICQVCRGQRKSSCGFLWSYL